MDQDTARERDDTRTSWHPAFLEAIKLELDQYEDILEYTPEYQLAKEPLRIDVVIIKKRKNVPIRKNIAAIFRGDNIIEYKSPSDHISLEDFYRVYAYACLYVTVKPRTAGDINDLTITLVGSHYPRKLVEHLEKDRHCTVEKTSPGVYSVRGDQIPMQIIDTRELPVEENIWLAGLDNRLDREMARKVLGEIYRSEQKAALTACFDVVYRKNIEAMEEASAMLDNIEAVLNTPLEKAGFVTRKMIQAATEAREENTKEIAQEALAKGIPIETVAEITKLDIKQVQALAGSR